MHRDPPTAHYIRVELTRSGCPVLRCAAGVNSIDSFPENSAPSFRLPFDEIQRWDVRPFITANKRHSDDATENGKFRRTNAVSILRRSDH